ncbi:MAG: hypothetical protein IKK11_03390, partial [Oscillospiraceae bacterium]|nr:hypothetical protein [Oscillospiraceae bacterium]
KAGALWAGLNATGNGLYHNGAAGTYKAINIAAADVGEWVQYTYTFTVDQTMIDTNCCNFILRMGLMRNSNAIVCDTISGKEVYNAEQSTPAVMYLDDFSVTEIVETASGIVIADDMVTVGSNGATSNMEFTLHAAEKNENPENIRKAYINFNADANYAYSRVIRLKMTATAAGKQTLTVYGLKNSQLPENLTYNNAPANQKDESLFEFDLYNRKALGTVEVDGAGTYYVDVTDYVRDYAAEGMLFVITGNGSEAVVLPEVSLEADRYEEPQPDLKFSNAALELHSNLAIQFKTNAGLFESSSYKNPYVVFNFKGNEKTVTEYKVENGQYVFTFTDIAPNQIAEKVQATLHADWNGADVASAPLSYGVSDYCYRMLKNSAVVNNDAYAELRTLLVDLLRYGAMAQKFTGFTGETVDAALTDAQAAWGTTGTPALESKTSTRYATVENPTASWTNVGLVLEDAVTMRFKFRTDSTAGLKVKITSDTNAEGWVIDAADFQYEESTGKYYVDFSGFHAGQMRESVYVTVYNGDTAVSNTLRYTIESYAHKYQTADATQYPYFAELVKAMMRYGDAAYNFAN